MRLLRFSVVLMCAGLMGGVEFALAQSAKPSTSPASRPAVTRPAPRERPTDVLRVPISTLIKEAETALRKKQPFPRSDSDFLKDQPAPAEEMLRTLQKPVSRDPRVDAYVKWQLLSGIEAFEGDHAAGALKAYVAATPILPTPTSPQDLSVWENKKNGAKIADLEKINADYAAFRKPFEDQNIPILLYRDALRKKIRPPEALQGKLFAAAFEDLSQRAGAGLDADTDFKNLAEEIDVWSKTASKDAIGHVLEAVNEYSQRTPAKILDKLTIGAADPYWRKRDLGLQKRTLNKLTQALLVAHKNAL